MSTASKTGSVPAEPCVDCTHDFCRCKWLAEISVSVKDDEDEIEGRRLDELAAREYDEYRQATDA